MHTSKSTSRFIFFSLSLLILLSLFTTTLSSEPTTANGGGVDDDAEGIEELIALDEEDDLQQNPDGLQHESKGRPSEAEVLTKAQRIVLELNSDNAKRIIDGHDYVFVLGYAPWCGRSAELMPRFAEAATALNELGSPVLMAKLDAEMYPKAASSLGIKGFPTLLLFVNGTSQPYSGGYATEEIVIWLRKKTGVPVIRLNQVTEANEFLKKHSTFVVGLFETFEGPDYQEFIKAAKSDNGFQFVETSSSEITNALFPGAESAKPFLGLVRNEPENYTAFYDTFQVDKILRFLEINQFPLVVLMNELNSAKVYSSSKPIQVYVFAEPDELEKFVEPLQDIARKFKSKIMTTLVDINQDNLAKPFLGLFGLEESKDTVAIAFDFPRGNKYLEADPKSQNIQKFCLGVLYGTMSPFYKSQSAPNNEDASILTVVGKTFDDFVLRSPKNILLEVHTPWCIHCDATSKQVEKLAKHFKGLKNLAFARFDASVNEHPQLQVDDYPALLFYPAKDKSNPINFPRTENSKVLAALINEHLKEQGEAHKDEL